MKHLTVLNSRFLVSLVLVAGLSAMGGLGGSTHGQTGKKGSRSSTTASQARQRSTGQTAARRITRSRSPAAAPAPTRLARPVPTPINQSMLSYGQGNARMMAQPGTPVASAPRPVVQVINVVVTNSPGANVAVAGVGGQSAHVQVDRSPFANVAVGRNVRQVAGGMPRSPNYAPAPARSLVGSSGNYAPAPSPQEMAANRQYHMRNYQPAPARPAEPAANNQYSLLQLRPASAPSSPGGGDGYRPLSIYSPPRGPVSETGPATRLRMHLQARNFVQASPIRPVGQPDSSSFVNIVNRPMASSNQGQGVQMLAGRQGSNQGYALRNEVPQPGYDRVVQPGAALPNPIAHIYAAPPTSPRSGNYDDANSAL